MIKKVELFSTKKEFFTFFIIALSIFTFNTTCKYYEYLEFTKFDTYESDALVINQYSKTAKNQILKLDIDGVTLYSSVSNGVRNMQGHRVHIRLFLDNISFFQYLKGFYARSYVLKLYPELSPQIQLSNYIKSQHQNESLSQIFSALFLATPMSSSLQQQLSYLGVNHLVAISGFHIGLIFTMIFFTLKAVTCRAYNTFIPYRNLNLDMFVMSAIIIMFYMLFLNSPPSLLRAFFMLIIGYFLYDRGYKIVSIKTLLVTVISILALHVELLFSIGFWLSASGVYYIFLFLKQFQIKSKILLAISISIWVYLMMFPISIYIFENFSATHFLSVFYSLAFVIFYPIELALHVIGYGGIFDEQLLLVIQTTSTVKL
ncbi:MAG: ComEC/Rec2 family competence protein, partial [Campylobacterota bacterium]|nr:ComEC/Rec2 family competence protein [Campylobacterota bacterium]